MTIRGSLMRPVRCAQSVIDPGHSDTREAMYMTYKMPYNVKLHTIDPSAGCSVGRRASPRDRSRRPGGAAAGTIRGARETLWGSLSLSFKGTKDLISHVTVSILSAEFW